MGRKKRAILLTCVLGLSLIFLCDDCLYSQPLDNEPVTGAGEGIKIATDVLAENCEDHEDPEDYIWDSSDVIQILLDGNAITANGDGATVDGNNITITSGGTYSVSGSLEDGQIIVDSEDEEIVRLILNGAYVSCSSSAAVFIKNAEKTIIVLAEDTENTIVDGRSYRTVNTEADEPNAVIFSKDNLTLCGEGSLTVEGNFKDGISSKDGLIIAGGTINVNAIDDGIRGKDYLVIKNGTITVDAGDDGLKSDNEDDETMGYVSIEAGVVDVLAGGDAMTAETDVVVIDGQISLCADSSHIKSRGSINTSFKGIKGVVQVVIDGGDFIIDSDDDAVHSNGDIEINGGSFVIASGDDGIHADADVIINGGEIRINKSYEGIESADADITINGGTIHIVSGDDGINVAAGGDQFGGGPGGGPGGPGGGPAPTPTEDDCFLYINGGYLVINAAGDGIDSNGSVEMTDGVVIINGPTTNMNGALDHLSFKMTGGFLVAVGSSGMAQAPSTSSTQYSILLTFNTARSAGTLFHIQNNQGENVLSFLPTKSYSSVAFSSQELTRGSSYDVYYGGTSRGTVYDGLYQDGAYTPGTKYTRFTVSSIVTNVR